ncbi:MULTISPECIES: VOC family protein [unclassified Fusibacter]|uniref:VOC family protein n=1 Tax=unclassified Fusibacter TaxID=2624464 RepID=UPI0010127E9C|nr:MULTISPECIES: VOC family protein [unclassified Fusibacter]MCK8059917.1 VOC family protein [Fusibacter sp. A2]NPE22059.1 VOC family protein [Fusibacter sp. A1]RXV60839.1 VOC family protein [Fusibacter sp. A1]
MLTKQNYTGEITCIISCHHLATSRKWYTDTLGFTLMYQVDDLLWAEFKTPMPGVTVGLEEVESFIPQNSILTISTPDIEAVASKLDLLDVKRDEIKTIEGLVKLMKIYDPDNNVLQFAQSLGV